MTRELIGLVNPRASFVQQLAQIITVFYKISGKKTSREEIERLIDKHDQALTEEEIQQLLDMQEHFSADMKLPEKPMGKIPTESSDTQQQD